MKLVEKYNAWIKTLFPFDDKKIFIWLGPAGLGDKISCLPAFRHLKKMHPDRKVILYVEPLSTEVWKSCRYIDYVIPEEIIKPDSLFIRKDIDIANKAWWSFFEHHQKHICKSNVEYICNIDYTDDIPLEYELSYWQEDILPIYKIQEGIDQRCHGKKVIGIAPAYTMYSRMWSVESWIKLTNLLKEAGYFVIALGGNNDLNVDNVDMDLRNKIPIRMVPKVIDYFSNIITLNSGMLHLASVNQTVPITYLNVGQFPAELIVPYRQGKLFHKVNVIEHECPMKMECFNGHIAETSIRPMMYDFLNTYKRETGQEYPQEMLELMKKYVCWHYCVKIADKYSCSRLITPEIVMERLDV